VVAVGVAKITRELEPELGRDAVSTAKVTLAVKPSDSLIVVDSPPVWSSQYNDVDIELQEAVNLSMLSRNWNPDADTI
jgi:hypothetical protein